MNGVFRGFDARHAALWGHQTLKVGHGLAERDVFSDRSLGGMIESMDPRHILITTMARDGYDLTSWRHCDRANLSGEAVLEALRHGRIWINMAGINEVDRRFADILREIYEELGAYMPGFRPRKTRLGLLISSPNAQVFYHTDIPGQGLWQIRGRKRVYVYPNTEPFLMPADLENVVRGLQEEDIPYQPWFDDHAQAIDLEPGEMLHWPLNGPHRVVNHDCVNVSLTTEHWTPEIRRQYVVNYGNGILRRQFGWTPRSRDISGAAYWSKLALTGFWKLSGLQKRQEFTRKATYRVDPAAPDGVTPLEPQQA